MKKLIIFLLIFIACNVVHSQTLFYGYRTNPAADQGFISFSSDNTANVTQLNNYREYDSFWSRYNQIAAGEFVKGDFFYNSLCRTGGAEYAGTITHLSTDRWDVIASHTLDPNTGPTTSSFWDMAYDYSTGTLYGLSSWSSSYSYLFTIDMETLEYELVLQDIPQGLMTLAIDLNGTIYSIARNGNLYTLNRETKATQLIGATGVTFSASPQSMAFDHNTGKLYWASFTSNTDGSLYEVNTATGAATLVGKIGNGINVVGLYIPYYENANIPEAPINLTATPGADNALTVTLNWTNPAKSREGKDLTELSSIVIERNGIVVHTISNPEIGANASWTDNNISEANDYTYTVYGKTNGDRGALSTVNVAVGFDPCDIRLENFPYTLEFETEEEMECFSSIYYYEANRPLRSDDVARSGKYSWRFSSRGTSPDYNQYLISPRLAASEGEKIIRFYYNTLKYDTEQFWVGYSTTDKEISSFTWTEHVKPNQTNGWVEYSQIFPPETKYIAVRYYVVYRWNLYIDDMTIDVLADKDAELQAITEPVTSAGLTADQQVTVLVRNRGTETLRDIPIRLTVDGVEKANETVPGPIARLETASFTFKTAKANLSALGKHTISVSTHLDGDKRPENDAKTVTVINYGDCISDLPLREGFEDAASLTCWTLQHTAENRPIRSRVNAHNGEYSIRFTSEIANADGDYNQYLITPKLPAESGLQKRLQFYCFATLQSTALFRVGYVDADITPESSNWESNLHWVQDFYMDGSAQWDMGEVLFPAATRYVIIHYYGSSGSGSLFIDDITIREVSNTDAAITAITSPISEGGLAMEEITIQVKNEGFSSISNIPVKYEVDGIIGSTEIVTGTLNAGQTRSFTFDRPADLSQAKTYTLKAYIDGLAGDESHDNDTISAQVTNYGDCLITGFPYNFGFEENLTSCWRVYDMDGDDYGHKWQRTTSRHHSGSWSIVHDNYLSQDGWLVMPKTTLPAGKTSFLSFWSFNTTYDAGKNSVWISIGSPHPEDGQYVEVWKQVGQTVNWEESVVSLYDYAGKDVYIAFRYQGNVAHHWFLDDISVYEVSGKDAGVTAIISPTNNGGMGQESVTVKIKNFGGEILEKIPMQLEVDGIASGVEEASITLKPNAEATYTFQAKADLSGAKRHTVTARTIVPNDTHPENDFTTVYITNSGPCEVTQFPYEDSFERTADLRVNYFICWTPYNLDGTPNTSWEVLNSFVSDQGSTLYPRSGDIMAGHDYYVAQVPQDDWLVSSMISIPASSACGLSFWSFNVYSAYYGKNSVLISTKGSTPGSDFKEVWSAKSVKADWEKNTINLAEYAGQNIYIAFRYQGRDAHAWMIDDISIDELPANDVGISQVVSPTAGGNKETKISIEAINYGANTINTIKAAYRLNDQALVEEQFNDLNLTSGKTVTLNFTQTVDLSAYDWYDFIAYTALDNDINRSNDTVSFRIRYRENITLYGYQLMFDEATSKNDLKGVSFQVNNPTNTESTVSNYQDEGIRVISAGEFYKDTVYLYSRYSSGYNWLPGNFIKTTLKGEEISKVEAEDLPDDMTYDYSSNTMYAIIQDADDLFSILTTVDLSTGTNTPVYSLDRTLRTIACNPQGVLYGIDKYGLLCMIDKQTGAITETGNMPVTPANDLQSMTFDQLSGDLYWASYDKNSRGRLVDVNLKNPEKSVNAGTIGLNSQIVALFSLYPRNHVNIFAPATDNLSIVIYPNPAKEQVYVSGAPQGSVISILDLSGRIIQSQIADSEKIALNLNLSKGLYFVQVKNKDMQAVQKLIVK
jgi:hypothetical protein